MERRVQVWQVGTWESDEGDLPTLTLGEIVDPGEFASMSEATKLLVEMLEASPYARAESRYNAWQQTLTEVAASFQGGPQGPLVLHHLSAALDDLLSAVRAFDDRTSHSLSQWYGKDSAEFACFQTALSVEFDASFAYRFCYKLRNYSQHCGSPISDIRAGSRLVDGELKEYFEPVFNSRTLLVKYKDWGKARPDLEAIKGEFSVVAIVDGLWASCERVYAKVLLQQQPHLVGALTLLRRYVHIVRAGGLPVLIQVPSDVERLEDLRRLTILPIRVDLSDLAETALQQAVVITGGLPDHLR